MAKARKGSTRGKVKGAPKSSGQGPKGMAWGKGSMKKNMGTGKATC